MNRKQFLQYHDELTNKLRKIVAHKNSDYTGHDFAFTNFCQIEVDGLATTEVGIWTRFRDKTSRLLTFLKGNILQVKEEKIEDTILDACNYLLILACYLKYKRRFGQDISYQHTDEVASAKTPIDDPWHCPPHTETVNTELGPVTVHYGTTEERR